MLISNRKNQQPFLIGVAGGISSGKSSVCKKIIEELSKLNHQHKKHILVISLDSFYKRLSQEELLRAERGDHNLDHPQSFDDELAYKTLIDLIEAKSLVEIPVYDKKSYKSSPNESIKVTPDSQPDVIIIEGILVFYYPKIRDLCQMKLFVDCDADTRLARRVKRDMSDYNRPLEQILNYYQKYVKPAFEEFCLPTKKYADVIIPRGVENLVAINLIVQHINDYLTNSCNDQTNESRELLAENKENNLNNNSKKVTPSSSKQSSSNSLSSMMMTTPTNSGLLSVNVTGGGASSGQLSSPGTPSKRSERPH